MYPHSFSDTYSFSFIFQSATNLQRILHESFENAINNYDI